MLKLIKKNKEIIGILLFALFLRIPLLNGSFWMDEAAQALEIIRPLSQQLDIIPDFQPPLLHLILHFTQYFSRSEWWLRTVGALIPGLITILFSYKLAEKLFNKKIAIISSLLLATSSFHIFFSQELRPYSLPAMFGTMSMYYFFQMFEEEYLNNKIKLSIVNLLGLYSSYLFPFLLISQFLFIIIKDSFSNKKIFSIYIKSQYIPVVGFLFWFPMFLKQLDAGEMVRKNLPGWENVVSLTQVKAMPLVIGKFIFGVLEIEPNLFFIIFGSLILVPLFLLLLLNIKDAFFAKKETFFQKIINLFKRKSNHKQNENIFFVLFWLVMPLLTSWLISFVVPVVRPKRLLFILPAFYILISYLTSFYLNKKSLFKSKLKTALSLTLLISIFFVNLISTLGYYTNPKLQRENWKELYVNITENFSPANTVIIYSFPEKFSPMIWYDSQNYPSIATEKLYINNVDNLAKTLKGVIEYDNVLVFDYLRDLTDPNKEIEKELINFEFREVGVLDYPNIGFVRIFSKPHTIIGQK